jgi:hypothetical protein
MRLKYQSYTLAKGAQKLKTEVAIILTALGLIIGSGAGLSLALFGSTQADAPTVIYNNIPNPLPGNLVSEAYEATSTSEYGGQVSFAGNARLNPNVTVIMSSWGCETGNWTDGSCVTTPGSTFSEPITLNIYTVGTANSLGAKIGSVTKTFDIPYRPSADNTKCTGDSLGAWYDANDNACYHGLATPVSFNLSGSMLPSSAIVTVAYNTSDYGYLPYGDATACHATSAGCGYDSLNVGVVNSSPTTGSDPVVNGDYLNSTWSGAYCDNGSGGTGSLRFDFSAASVAPDPVCPYQPAIEVTAQHNNGPVGSVTGGLTLAGPHQQISIAAFDFGANSSKDFGTVEYQNFDYPGGLHYVATIKCVTVSGNNATFMFQIPPGHPGLSGLYVVASVHDGGSPAKSRDTYGHTATASLTQATNWCENANAPVTNYAITGGNVLVHEDN